jgi:predicted nucleic acid-binding protein
MILVDTSVWVQHLQTGNPRLGALLRDEQVLSHPFVVGELACGNLRNREEILALLAALPEARVAEHHEVLHLVGSARLYGRGLGWVDAHLLASALLSRCAFWTLDKRLQRVAATLRTPA